MIPVGIAAQEKSLLSIMTVGRNGGSVNISAINATGPNVAKTRPNSRLMSVRRAKYYALMLVFLLVQHCSAFEGGRSSSRPPSVVAGLGSRRRDADEESLNRGDESGPRRDGFVIRSGSAARTRTNDPGGSSTPNVSGWASTNVDHRRVYGGPGPAIGTHVLRPELAHRARGGEQVQSAGGGPGYYPQGSQEVGNEASRSAIPPGAFEGADERIAAGLREEPGLVMPQAQDAASSAYPQPSMASSAQATSEVGNRVRARQEPPSIYQEAGRETLFVMFLVLAWRSLSNLETVTLFSGALKWVFRATMVLPATGLVVGNLVCMCLSLVRSATIRQKARMKIMLNIDAVAESILLACNLVRYFYSEPIGREELLVGLFANLWFVSLCYTFRKARWTVDDSW